MTIDADFPVVVIENNNSILPITGVGQIIAGDNITISPSNGRGNVTINSTGGGSPGSPILHAIDFTYNTPNLATGAAVYTPVVATILLDAWISITQAWNGTTPLAEVGQFIGITTGWSPFGAIDMTQVDGNLGGAGLVVPGASGGVMQGAIGRFTTTDAVKIVVSQNGTTTGGDPGASQGEATLYLLIGEAI